MSIRKSTGRAAMRRIAEGARRGYEYPRAVSLEPATPSKRLRKALRVTGRKASKQFYADQRAMQQLLARGETYESSLAVRNIVNRYRGRLPVAR